jgi:hypothetical protein
VVKAVVDGSPWSGTVNYSITGQKIYSGSSVPNTFGELPAGTYTFTYNSGGPPSATLISITPWPIQTSSSGGTITFTLDFHKELAGTIAVNATVDGLPWSGPVNYTITGPFTDSDSSVPKSFGSKSGGTYTLTYNYGGPPGATLVSIKLSPTQTLSAGGAMTFTLNFSKRLAGNIVVNATVDGSQWSGPVNYTDLPPKNESSDNVRLEIKKGGLFHWPEKHSSPST